MSVLLNYRVLLGEMEQRKIIELIKARDPRGAEEFMKNYSPLIHYVIGPIVKDSHDREECLNDICMRVWDRIDNYDPDKGSWTTWVTVISRNIALNTVRKRKTITEDLPVDVADSSQDPEAALLKTERVRALNEALMKLKSKDRLGYKLFYRKYYYMQSTVQIAAELGMTVKAVENRLYRIKKQLRKELGGVADGR